MQGQSHETPWKLRGIDAVMRMQCELAKVIFARMAFPVTYFHFDLFAGSGINDQIDGCEPLPGSPIVASDVLKASGIPHLIFAVEREKERVRQLVYRTSNIGNVYPFEADNADIIPLIPRIISSRGEKPDKAIGTILIDPNKSTDIAWTPLNEVLSKCPKLDVIFNFPGNAEKRKRYAGCAFLPINELPTQCHRKHWMIRNAAEYGKHQFCLCVGRNYRFDDYAKEGFFHWHSTQGKFIRSKIMNNKYEHELSQSSLNRQWLFDVHEL